jgi:ABC-type antimicrobial peptide transport system permease subunit
VYGVAAQFVAQRRRELAIRLALGADDTSVMRLVLREGLATALAGALAGLGAAFALGGLMRDVIFQVSPADPATYVASAGLLLASVVLASFIPARRASRLPPAEVLAAE